MLVVVDAGKLGTPSLYPSTFVNNQSGKNDHTVSPVTYLNSVHCSKKDHLTMPTNYKKESHLNTMQSLDRCVKSMAVMQMTQSVA